MTNTNNIVANEGNKLIADAMNANQANDNRQSKLTMFLFSNEVSYSRDALTSYFKLAGSDKQEQTGKLIANISDDYNNVLELLNTLKAEKKAVGKDGTFSDAKALQIEQLNGKVRAAHILFERAALGCFHLRTTGAYEVKLRANGAISFMADKVDEKGQPVLNTKKQPVAQSFVMSGNALIRAGQKAIEAIKPKGKAASAKNPVAGAEAKGGLGTVASVIASRVKQQVSAGHTIEDFAEDEEKQLKSLLHTLMAATFLDDKGNVDRKTVIEYLEAEFPRKDGKAAA